MEFPRLVVSVDCFVRCWAKPSLHGLIIYVCNRSFQKWKIWNVSKNNPLKMIGMQYFPAENPSNCNDDDQHESRWDWTRESHDKDNVDEPYKVSSRDESINLTMIRSDVEGQLCFLRLRRLETSVWHVVIEDAEGMKERKTACLIIIDCRGWVGWVGRVCPGSCAGVSSGNPAHMAGYFGIDVEIWWKLLYGRKLHSRDIFASEFCKQQFKWQSCILNGVSSLRPSKCGPMSLNTLALVGLNSIIMWWC